MWMVVHMAKSLTNAQSIQRILTDEGFLVKRKPVYRAVSDEENYYELLVPESEAEEARQLLLDHGFC